MRLAVVVLAVLASLPVMAHGRWWIFQNVAYYDPLIAGVREPHVSVLLPAFFDRMEFMVEDDERRMGWDIDVGAEMPLFGREGSLKIGEVDEDESAWGFWLPIDFHMIEDFGDESAPIVNTDYRFGLMFKYRRGIGPSRWLAFRAHFGHESTHLGDEFSIHGDEEHPDFERINVSWEYLDLGALYEWHSEHVWDVRGGVTMTVPFSDTYYLVGPGSATRSPTPVTESTNWWDPYLGIQVLNTQAFNRWNKKFDVYASTEMRWRSVYAYHKTDPDASEERQLSINIIIGVKESGSDEGMGRFSPFLRVYRGVNTHGQFRNQKDYTEIGAGVRMVR